MEFLTSDQVIIFLELLLAACLGAIIGLERECQRKEAGLRTYTLVSLGSALFVIIGREAFFGLTGNAGISFDPSRVVAALIMGVGFIGAGTIIHRETRIEGLTTAAGLWLVAAIGGAVGSRFYLPAIFTALLTLVILTGLRQVEEKFLNKEK